RRAERYLKAGADGVFVEAPETPEELRKVGETFRGVPQIANMLEGGRTPMLTPAELYAMGFAMIAYPTTLILRVARTIEKALDDLLHGRLNLADEGIGFDEFKSITDYERWARIEEGFTR
ncbi:MAG: isocitrate lyase/phosphoenolpyruvate mutase family protein, partial [Rhodospirillales bacterium]|nr:isocitrate lyase/phosphoenolpyruvate mutase family protein [Rhodospirillales bacterium]